MCQQHCWKCCVDTREDYQTRTCDASFRTAWRIFKRKVKETGSENQHAFRDWRKPNLLRAPCNYCKWGGHTNKCTNSSWKKVWLEVHQDVGDLKRRVITNVSFREQDSAELHYSNPVEKGSNLSSHFQECIPTTTRAWLHLFLGEQSKFLVRYAQW